jgi:hypothetical protein
MAPLRCTVHQLARPVRDEKPFGKEPHGADIDENQRTESR